MTTNLLTPPARLWTPEDLEILDAATRREFLAMLAAAGLLAACGDGRGEAEDDAGASTRSFVDARGKTLQVPTQPERIVAMNGNGAQQLLSLGVPLTGLATGTASSTPGPSCSAWIPTCSTVSSPWATTTRRTSRPSPRCGPT